MSIFPVFPVPAIDIARRDAHTPPAQANEPAVTTLEAVQELGLTMTDHLEALFSPVLTLRHVALILQCSVNVVRKIPRQQLRRRKGLGKELIYLRADVEEYIRQLPLAEPEN